MSSILTCQDVSINFGGVKAVQNVSLDIQKGSVTSIIGPNGAGKTCLLYTSPSPRDTRLSRMPSSA